MRMSTWGRRERKKARERADFRFNVREDLWRVKRSATWAAEPAGRSMRRTDAPKS